MRGERFATSNPPLNGKWDEEAALSSPQVVCRLELIEQLWDSLSEEERDSLPLTPEQEMELDRRLDTLEKEGSVDLAPEQLPEQLRRRST